HVLVNGVSKPSDDAEDDYILLTVGDTPLKLSAVAKKTHGLIVMVQPDATQGVMTAHYTDDGQQKDLQDSTWVALETPVTFVVTPQEGYEMASWKVNDETKELESADPNQLTLPVEGDIKVEPVLKEKANPQPTMYTVTLVSIPASEGHFFAYYGEDETTIQSGASLPEGTKVSFFVTPAEGYELDYWEVDEKKSDDMSIPLVITLSKDVKVRPVMKAKAAPQPTMYTVQMIQPKESQGTMTAHYTDDATQAVTDGMSVEKGVKVTFVVTPKEGYEMESWKVNDETKELESADPNQLTLLVNDNTKVEPVLKAKAPVNPTEATLTIKREGTGATISGKYVTPDEMNFSIWEGNTKQVPLGSKVTLTAALTEGFEVTYMNNGNPAPAEALSEEGKVYTFIVQGDVTVVAKVTEKQVTGEFTVTCIADPEEGGKVSASTAEGPITNGAKVAAGEFITIKATPEENFEVDQWFLNNRELKNKKGYSSFTFLLAEDVTIRVTFKSTLPPPEYAVTVEPTLPSAEAGNVQLFQKNGTPFESGKSVVTGTEMYVEVTPADKYELEMLQVGETKLPAGDEKLVNIAGGGVKYTFTVTAATKVQATFKLSNSIELLAQSGVAVFVTNGGTRLEIAGAAEGTEVRLYDYTGQLLLASTEQTLDISALPAGSYIVLVGDYTTRIVK
ncbi:T9SS type A sorting domain-containing protein, partial [Porphyromonas sp.]|uniref:T9SS type A sorting domain-containing protein n=1 Tax=Porphyromonas sp. TaxID=1924944 RepID=UPI0025D5601E